METARSAKRQTFFVRAFWDEKAQAYCSESNIDGLVIEAETLEEFEAVLLSEAIELIVENHFTLSDLTGMPLKDLIPTIVWQRPDGAHA